MFPSSLNDSPKRLLLAVEHGTGATLEPRPLTPDLVSQDQATPAGDRLSTHRYNPLYLVVSLLLSMGQVSVGKQDIYS